jgi:hypothetical protein
MSPNAFGVVSPVAIDKLTLMGLTPAPDLYAVHKPDAKRTNSTIVPGVPTHYPF